VKLFDCLAKKKSYSYRDMFKQTKPKRNSATEKLGCFGFQLPKNLVFDG